jgi:hypothetical protein
VAAGTPATVGRVNYYDRQGNRLTLMEWAKRYEGKTGDAMTAEKRVAETTLPDGTWVSTVWLGLDHSFGEGPPLIFETMVFPSKDGPLNELDCDRYSTEAEALAGHAAMVERWAKPRDVKD